MYPIINILGKPITTYALMVLVGILLLLYLCIKWAKRFKVDDNLLIVLLLWSALGALIGSHILYGLVNIKLVSNLIKVKGLKDLIYYLYLIFGGSVFYGGLIGALIAGLIYLKVKKLDVKLYSYIMTPMIPLFHFFGRIGCFLTGCCYGIESKIGFIYHNSLVESANNVRRFPVQLVEAGCNLILFIILYYFQKNGKFKNSLLIIYLMSYSVIRFILEFFRGDTYRGIYFGLSTSQIISIIIFISCLIYLLLKKLKKAKK